MTASMWMIVGMLVAVALLVELVVVLIWTRGLGRVNLALGLALLVINQVLLPPLLSGSAGGVLVRQLINMGGLVLLGFGVIASRPVKQE